MKQCKYSEYKVYRHRIATKVITLKRLGVLEVTLWRDCFGVYMCRIWIGFDYYEGFSRNKFTEFRSALKQL